MISGLILKLLVVPTYDTKTLSVLDASTYPVSPATTNPTIEITIPGGFPPVSLPFTQNSVNVFNSEDLELTPIGADHLPIPDGIYKLKYTVGPGDDNIVEMCFLKVDQLQEKFDEAFMKLDIMECDRAIKTQSKVELNTIYFFIQGAIAAANNCASSEALRLYTQAQKMLNNFIKNSCDCSGTNYLINFN